MILLALRYLGQGRLTYRGDETHRRYEWHGHGATQEVTSTDAAALLLMTRKEGGCCGAPKHDVGPLFEEVSDNTHDEAQNAPLEE